MEKPIDYMSWCLSKGKRIYPVTEFEVLRSVLKNDLDNKKITIQQFQNKEKELIEIHAGKRSEKLFIAVETNGVAEFGTMVFTNNFNEQNVNIYDQIRLLYKLIYNKDNPQK